MACFTMAACEDVCVRVCKVVCMCVWISLGYIVCVKVEKKEKQTQTEHKEESSRCCVRKYEFNTFLLISKTP